MTRYLPLALAVLVVGCADATPTGPSLDLRFSSSETGIGSVTVMSQNLYVGADVDAVIVALASPDPTDDVPALLFAIETLGKTDFAARAEAIADQVARARPDVLGLQEVEVLDINLAALGVPVDIHLDFLAILQAELAERGLSYTVAAQVQNIVAAPLPGISLVDFDAILVDPARVTVTAAGGQNFAANVGVIAPGVELKRGWVWARATVRGEAYAFVNTHAEPDLAGAELSGLRAAQVSELVASFTADDRVVMMGDFNDVPGSPMYQVMAGAGFADVWAALRAHAPGLTCCHRANLSDQVAVFSQRIDYVFTRGLAGAGDRLLGTIDRFGEVPADRIPGPAYPIWPSDHVGIVATVAAR